jgi:hypothetical protein
MRVDLHSEPYVKIFIKNVENVMSSAIHIFQYWTIMVCGGLSLCPRELNEEFMVLIDF